MTVTSSTDEFHSTAKLVATYFDLSDLIGKKDTDYLDDDLVAEEYHQPMCLVA